MFSIQNRPVFDARPEHELKSYGAKIQELVNTPTLTHPRDHLKVSHTKDGGRVLLDMNLILGGREENIIKFNHDNEVEWKRSEYLTDTNDSIYVIDLEELENGNFIAVGRMYEDQNQIEWKLAILVIDDQGELESYQLLKEKYQIESIVLFQLMMVGTRYL